MTAKKKEEAPQSLWDKLSHIDVSDRIEEKNGMRYLSWAWAWGTLKENCPDATYEKHLFSYGTPTTHSLPYMTDKNGNGFVMVTVTAKDQSVTEVYPIINYSNKAVKNPESFQGNSALQRCLAKCVGCLGLGHYIYAGEDIPPDAGSTEEDVPVAEEKPPVKKDTGKQVVDKANKSEMVKEVKKQFGEEAKVSVVVDKANQNVYDEEGGLMFGYNEETHAFVMDENYDVSNQIDLVTEVVSRILPDFDLQAITNFFTTNKKVFQELGERSGTKWTELPFMSVIGKRNAELKGD